jgi:hypothetical protein
MHAYATGTHIHASCLCCPYPMIISACGAFIARCRRRVVVPAVAAGLHVCVCVCMYVCMYVCYIHTHIHIPCTFAYKYTIHVHKSIIYTYIQTHAYTRMYINTSLPHICLPCIVTCIHKFMSTYSRALCVCVRMYIYIYHIHTYIYIYTYIYIHEYIARHTLTAGPYACVCVCIYIYIYIYTSTYAYMNI